MCTLGNGLFNRLEGELEAREKSPGLHMSDLLTLPEPESGLLNWMIRIQASALEHIGGADPSDNITLLAVRRQ